MVKNIIKFIKNMYHSQDISFYKKYADTCQQLIKNLERQEEIQSDRIKNFEHTIKLQDDRLKNFEQLCETYQRLGDNYESCIKYLRTELNQYKDRYKITDASDHYVRVEDLG